eukprot:jgi/Pico_ML_1/54100/g4523.t1
MMNRIFGHLTFAKVYVDDILIHSSSKEAHFQHLEELLQLTTAPALVLYDEDHTIRIETDASNIGMGAVLYQEIAAG